MTLLWLPVAAAVALLSKWSRRWRLATGAGAVVATGYMLSTVASQAVLASAAGLVVVGLAWALSARRVAGARTMGSNHTTPSVLADAKVQLVVLVAQQVGVEAAQPLEDLPPEDSEVDGVDRPRGAAVVELRVAGAELGGHGCGDGALERRTSGRLLYAADFGRAGLLPQPRGSRPKVGRDGPNQGTRAPSVKAVVSVPATTPWRRAVGGVAGSGIRTGRRRRAQPGSEVGAVACILTRPAMRPSMHRAHPAAR